MASSSGDDDRILLEALRRGWITDSEIKAIRTLRAEGPDIPLLDILQRSGFLDSEQVAALQPRTVRGTMAPDPAGEAAIRPGLEGILGPRGTGSRYRFGRLLGRGGMGEVIEALDCVHMPRSSTPAGLQGLAIASLSSRPSAVMNESASRNLDPFGAQSRGL